MHHCLNVDEIVRLIACELVTPERKATAVCLACCCKGFQDPVLDTLWATQLGLFQLFQCFPGDVWNEGGYTVSTPTTLFFPSSTLGSKEFQTTSDDDGMDSFPEVCSKNARAQRPAPGHSGTQSSEVYAAMQLHAVNEPLLPNLTTLNLWAVRGTLIQFLPFFLSPRITSISLQALAFYHSIPVAASVIANLPKTCPNLQDINLQSLPRDPVITAAASKMFFAASQNALRRFHVDSPLTEEANQALYKSQNLCSLSVVAEKGTPIPSASLPNLISLQIECEDGSDGLQLFRGATFGKLESVNFNIKSKLTGDFLEAFKEGALSSSIQNTLSTVSLTADFSWNLNYSSLLPFIRLVDLQIVFPCGDGCSGMDDDTFINLSRAMPKLQSLKLGDWPCDKSTGGVTAKGIVALAHNCPNLYSLRVHFQATTLSDPPTGLETTDNAGHSVSWKSCALTELDVGRIPVLEESKSMVALTLLQIFPRIRIINYTNGEWFDVENMIHSPRRIVDCSSGCHYSTIPRILADSSRGPDLRPVIERERDRWDDA